MQDEKQQSNVTIKRALISVSDKTNIIELALFLRQQNIDILSTGGTYKILKEANIDVTEVSDITNFPEIMDGRVKTLHPNIHGGLLARTPQDLPILAQHNITPIELLIVNLYPFQETIAKGASYDEAVENIDIGGPAIMRAASKNHQYVTVLSSVNDYDDFINFYKKHHYITYAKRQYYAMKAFAHTAAYDHAIETWFHHYLYDTSPATPQQHYNHVTPLRYGENPHQQAWFCYNNEQKHHFGGAQQLQGKELSYNNYYDSDHALRLVRTLPNNGAVIVKHTDPCGFGVGDTIEEAYQYAYNTDPTSAFGGIVALNSPLNLACATLLCQTFLEVIIAPSLHPNEADDIISILASKPNTRVLLIPDDTCNDDTSYHIRSINGGALIQQQDEAFTMQHEWQVVTERTPTPAEYDAMQLAWAGVKYARSNAIVIADNYGASGIGAGATSRVDAAKHACAQHQKFYTRNSPILVAASDAFFPFADSIEILQKSGIQSIIQPGGAKNDKQVIDYANKHNLAMLFTHMRHFRH